MAHQARLAADHFSGRPFSAWPIVRAQFALRTDDMLAYWEAIRPGLGVGFVANYVLATDPGVRRVLPTLSLAALPIWLTVHRKVRSNGRIRAVYAFLAPAVPQALTPDAFAKA